MFVPFGLGKFTVIGRIRYGGMAEVLKAQRVEEDGSITSWAVKRPLPTIVEDEELLSLFWKETELMQKLRNQAFPRVIEVGISQKIPHMVMEYIPGVSVRKVLDSDQGDASSVRPESWVMMASELATAVGELHRYKKGDLTLVHGDITASNVMLDTSGRIRLLDLGLALANEGIWRRIQRGRSNQVPAFLQDRTKSPEVDTHAISKLLIECLGGAAIFEPKSRIPRGLVELLRRATDPSGMYAFKSARSLKWELKAYLDQDRLEAMKEELGAMATKLQDN